MPNPIPNFILPDDLEAQYVNFVRISHTAAEFVMDFSLLLPASRNPPSFPDRDVPYGCQALFGRDEREHQRYETKFGQISLPGNHTLQMNYSTPITRIPRNPMVDIEELADRIRESFEHKNTIRDQALAQSRVLTVMRPMPSAPSTVKTPKWPGNIGRS